MLSAEQVAGERTPGKASGDIRHHGTQPGCVQPAAHKVKVTTAYASQNRRRSEDPGL